ncbi:MAG: hypothetical protein AB8G95_24040 [Anaerolineae bacterium]
MSQAEDLGPVPSMILVTILFMGAFIFSRLFEPTPKPPANLDKTITITNSEFDFSVNYPEILIGEIYGEGGYKGQKHLRFQAYSYRAVPGLFDIEIEIREFSNPTLDDVVQWQMEYISSREMPHAPYDRILLRQMDVKGNPAMRHMYKFRWSELIYDSFYFTRNNELIVIEMRVEQDYYEDYKNDFEKLVESFEPLE